MAVVLDLKEENNNSVNLIYLVNNNTKISMLKNI